MSRSETACSSANMGAGIELIPLATKWSSYRFAIVAQSGPPVDFVTGFRGSDGKTRGRPVGVTVDPRGALIVADDLSNTVWRVTVQGAES